MLKDQGRRLALLVAHHVQQLDDVGAPGDALEDLDFPLDLALLDRLEHLELTHEPHTRTQLHRSTLP